MREMSNEKVKIETDKNKVSEDDTFGDPLEQAFSVEEVGRLGGKIGNITASVHELLATDDKRNVEQAELEMIKLATEMINKKQYSDAIELVADIRKKCNALHGQVYKLASDAFIGLNRFKDAEIFALMAIQKNEKTISVFVNLASFAAMRKDQIMAKHWIMEAEKIDSENDNVKQCRELLFPKNKLHPQIVKQDLHIMHYRGPNVKQCREILFPKNNSREEDSPFKV